MFVIFSNTPVLTFSIDVVFILSIGWGTCNISCTIHKYKRTDILHEVHVMVAISEDHPCGETNHLEPMGALQ